MQVLERPEGQEFLTIRTDDPKRVGEALVGNGAVFLGVNSVTGKDSFFLVQGQLVLVVTK